MAVFFRAFAVAAAVALYALPVSAESAKNMYLDAMAREQTVRASMSAGDVSPALLDQVRSVVSAYEALVKRFPTSGYSDNALWQAGRLSLETFERFGQTRDRDAGVRLLRKLARTYVTSKFAKQVPEQLARAGEPASASSAIVPPAPPPASAAPKASPAEASSASAPPSTAPREAAAGPTAGASKAADKPPPVGPSITAAAARTTSVATIKAIRRTVMPDVVRVTIELDAEAPFHEEQIPNPARVFVDLSNTRAVPALVDRTLRFDGDADVVRQVRVGRHANNTTRVVLDGADVTRYSVYTLYEPFRIVIDCERATAAGARATVAAVPRPAEPTGRGADLRAGGAETAAPSASSRASATPPPPKEPPKPSVRPLAAHRLSSGWTRPLPSTRPRFATAIASAHEAIAAAAVVADASALAADTANRNARAADPRGRDTGDPVGRTPQQHTQPAPRAARTAEPHATDEGIVLPQPGVVSPDAVSPTAAPMAGLPKSTTTPPPSKNVGGGFSIARQLGLGVSRIVIDPGHGGHDPGAKGKTVTEAELVLDVALRLEKLLQKVPGVEVILTRRTDDFIALQERTAIANREGADLFLSIHANASNSALARGIETYFLNFANNLSAAAVAARENAASGQAMGALPDIVKAIALNNKLDESRDFATQVQRAMIERLRGANKSVKDLGVKQAPFVVLIGAAMPSVLAEISFVTNAQEARLLKGSSYRDRIAEALFEAIRKYQTSLTHATAVALQD